MRPHRRLPSIALATAAVALFAADAAAGEPPPAPAAPAPAVADKGPEVRLEFEKYTLDNGLEVVLHRDPAAPQIAVNVWYHVGGGDETPGKSGFAHLFEHMMFQGTKHTGSDVHFPILEEIGATSINGSTTTDRTNYYQTVPRHHLETALWLESDRMGYLLDALTEESFRNQVDVVRNERRQRYDNQPYGMARFAVGRALYAEGHPYRHLVIGLHEDLEGASLDDVRAFFRTWYVPSNATLVLAGDLDVAQAKALVEKWFGGFPKLPKPERRTVATPPPAETRTVEVPDAFAQLEQIQRTWIGPPNLAEGSFELAAAFDVLGSSGWGRLYKRLVVEESLCSVVWAGISGRRHASELIAIARLKPGADRARVEAIMDEEIARLIAEPVSDAELRRVVVTTESELIWGLEGLSERADQLQWFNHYTGDPGYATRYLERLRAVTPASVQAAAAEWLSKPYAQVVTVPAAPPAPPKASDPSEAPSAPSKGDDQ